MKVRRTWHSKEEKGRAIKVRFLPFENQDEDTFKFVVNCNKVVVFAEIRPLKKRNDR